MELIHFYSSSLLCAFQGCSAVDDGRTGVLVGTFSHSRDWNGDGIKITTDGGNKWSQINGNTRPAIARYGNNFLFPLQKKSITCDVFLLFSLKNR